MLRRSWPLIALVCVIAILAYANRDPEPPKDIQAFYDHMEAQCGGLRAAFKASKDKSPERDTLLDQLAGCEDRTCARNADVCARAKDWADERQYRKEQRAEDNRP